MRLLFLANNDIGLYKFRKELLKECLDKGFEVYISVPNGEYVKLMEEMGCSFLDTPVDRRGINPKKDISLLKHYRRIIKDLNPDLIITYTIKPNIYGGIASRKAKKQYAVNITGLGTAFEKRGIIREIVILLYRYALKKAKVIFFENNSNRDQLVSLRCCKENQTIILNGAGVDTDYYSLLPFPNNETVKFLFIGRVMKEKGIEELFLASKRLINEGAHCTLDVVGPLEEDYANVIESYQTEGWLKYYGFQNNIIPFIKECDCFVLPSYHEGMANTNLESASSGRPIITSNIPGCREAVINDISGFLCEPKSVDSLYICMKKMLSLGVKEREKMGIEGRNHVEHYFEKKKVVENTMCSLLG